MRPAPVRTPTTGVFVDGDWLVGAVQNLRLIIDYRQLAQAFRDAFGAGTTLYFVASLDGSRREHQGLLAATAQAGFQVKLAPPVRAHGRAGGVDVLLAIEAATQPRG